MQLTIAFDSFLPVARWGPLFHVLCLEQPRLTLDWRPVGFPTVGRSSLDDADAGLLVEPVVGPGLDSLTIDSSPMVAIMAVGHPLARRDELSVADILDERFLDVQGLDPRWRAVWTLDDRRGAPAKLIARALPDANAALPAIASGAAIGTVPEWAASGLHHPGVVCVALRDGPAVATRVVWHANDDNPMCGRSSTWRPLGPRSASTGRTRGTRGPGERARTSVSMRRDGPRPPGWAGER